MKASVVSDIRTQEGCRRGDVLSISGWHVCPTGHVSAPGPQRASRRRTPIGSQAVSNPTEQPLKSDTPVSVPATGLSRPRRHISWILGLIVVCLAVTYSVLTNPQWGTFDTELFLSSFRNVDWRWISLAFLAVYATYGTRALRWRILMQPVKPNPSLRNLLAATIIGFAAIGVMGRAGEFVRPYLVARKESVPITSQIGVWLFERSFDAFAILASVAFAIGHAGVGDPRLQRSLDASGKMVGIAIISLVVLMILLRGYYDSMSKRVLDVLHFLPKPRWDAIRSTLEVFGRGLLGIRDTRSVLLCMMLSAVQWLLIAAAYYAILSAFGGMNVTLSRAVVFMGVVMAGSILQIPAVGGGLQVASILALTEMFHVQVEVASSLSILIWALTFLAVIPQALVLVVWEGWSWRKLRELEYQP